LSDGRGSGQRDDDVHPGVREREIAARIAAVGAGWQVVDAIRGRVPGVPVLVITGVDDPSVHTRARRCQVSLLPKPFGIDVLKGWKFSLSMRHFFSPILG
jgi:hypothetical protein